MPSFSHGPHAASNRSDPSPGTLVLPDWSDLRVQRTPLPRFDAGWWQAMVGPGKAIDTKCVSCPAQTAQLKATTSPPLHLAAQSLARHLPQRAGVAPRLHISCQWQSSDRAAVRTELPPGDPR